MDRRTSRFGATALGVAITGATAAATLIAYPATASGLGALVTTVTCSVTGANWCISGNNTSSGIGVIGTSKTGTALRGTSTSQYGLKATSVSNYAILAQTTTGSAAISATASSGYGISGTSTTGTAGVFGSSGIGSGVYGYASSINNPGIGVAGYSYNGYGLRGSAPGSDGYGVEGIGGTVGVSGFSPTGIGVSAVSGSSTRPALSVNNSGGGDGIDVTSNVAVTASSEQGYAFLGATGSGRLSLELDNSDSGLLIFNVTSAGDVNAHSINPLARRADGATIRSFVAKTSIPVVEDFGTAQLTAGAAAVALDPTFASSIDPRAGYRVYLNPNGDTRGLYTASKTPRGFVVRETGGGRATLSFDYRIVATAAGQNGQRMAVIKPASLHGAAAVGRSVADVRAKNGTVLRGTSTLRSGLKATSVSNIAILAQTTTGSPAISATAGNGVSGTSTNGTDAATALKFSLLGKDPRSFRWL